jgi:ATP-grasp domain
MEKKVYNAAESSKFLKDYVSIPKFEVVNHVDEIKIKAPLVLKILSKDALHKTEINGVKIVMYNESVTSAFSDLMKEAQNHKITPDGIFVQEFVKGIESIVGIKKDPVFGHMILFGLGGVFTEVVADTSTRKCPITMEDADEMISELKSSRVFHEFRGMKVDFNGLKKSLVRMSQLPLKHPEIEELDINPFTLTSKDSMAVDIRIISS